MPRRPSKPTPAALELRPPLIRLVPVTVQRLYDQARTYARTAAQRGEDWDWLRTLSAAYLRSAKRRRCDELNPIDDDDEAVLSHGRARVY